MTIAFHPDRVTEAAKVFLRVTAGENLTLRLIAADFITGSPTPSTDFTEPADTFYAAQDIPYTKWVFSTQDNAVLAFAPTCVFALQTAATIYGFWLHRPGNPDDWVIQLKYLDGPHVFDDQGGAEVVTPALQWFTGVQVSS